MQIEKSDIRRSGEQEKRSLSKASPDPAIRLGLDLYSIASLSSNGESGGVEPERTELTGATTFVP